VCFFVIRNLLAFFVVAVSEYLSLMIFVLLRSERCRAVYYCSEKCRDGDAAAGSDSDADSHQFWCEKALTYRMDCDIGSFPFSFAAGK
jgi:hypothetical protein